MRFRCTLYSQPLLLRDWIEARDCLYEYRCRIACLSLDREASGLDAGEVEQILCEPVHTLRCAPDSFDVFAHSLALIVWRQTPREQTRAHEDAPERIQEIVGYDRKDLFTDARRLLRLLIQASILEGEGGAAR